MFSIIFGGVFNRFGGTHARAIQHDFSALESTQSTGEGCCDEALIHIHDCSERLEATDVFNDRSGTDPAATGQRNAGMAETAEQGADAEKTGPQAVDEFVRRL